MKSGTTGENPGGEKKLTEISYTVFDTETTGLHPMKGDEIVSIGAVRIVNGRILREETFDHIVDPGRPIPAASTNIHGIDDARVKGEKNSTEVIRAFSRFAENTVLVGHSTGFDLKFFEIKEKQTGVKLSMPVLDTGLLSAVAHPYHEDHSIEGIAGRVGVRVTGRHTALGDAIATAELFLKLVPLLAEMEIHTLAQAQAACRRIPLMRNRY